MSIIDPNTGQPFIENGTNPFAPPTVESFPPLSSDEFDAMRNMAVQSLTQAPPATPVALSLQAMCQIVRLIDRLNESIEHRDTGLDAAKNLAQRQALHGKHEQDRLDAEAWLKQFSYLWDESESDPKGETDANG